MFVSFPVRTCLYDNEFTTAYFFFLKLKYTDLLKKFFNPS